MKRKDIIVGRKYKHRNHEDAIYLGIGKRILYTMTYSKKFLVVIEADDKNSIGMIVKTGDEVQEGFWDGFYLIEE